VGNVFLTFGREGLLVASAAAKSDDDHFTVALQDTGTGQQTAWEETAAESQAGGIAEEVAAGNGKGLAESWQTQSKRRAAARHGRLQNRAASGRLQVKVEQCRKAST